MKKFTLIPVGECFEYQGKQYSKSGPLTAIALSSNRQRMIPRSAMVMPVTAESAAAAAGEPQPTAFSLDSSDVENAFELYHNGCTEWLRLAEKELSEETARQIREALEASRKRFLSDLGF